MHSKDLLILFIFFLKRKLTGIYCNFFLSNIIKFCIITLIIFITSDCKKEVNNYVPDVPINYELNLTSELADLGVNQLVTITRDPMATDYSIVDYHNSKYQKYSILNRTYGNGIILFRSSYYEYKAFDLTCTYRAFEDHCALTVEGREYLPICPCCKSVFILTADGLPSKGSNASIPLMRYNVSSDGLKLIITK